MEQEMNETIIPCWCIVSRQGKLQQKVNTDTPAVFLREEWATAHLIDYMRASVKFHVVECVATIEDKESASP
jgi:hypothetical protein